MATITLPNTFAPNTSILSAQVNSNFSTIYNEFNGNISNANLSATAAIARTKLATAIGAKIRLAAAQTLSNNSETTVAFTTEAPAQTFDDDTMHDTSTNPTRLTFTTAGTYVVGGIAQFASNATGQRYVSIRIGGATSIAYVNKAAVSGDQTWVEASTLYKAAAADYMELRAYQDSGGNLDINTPNTQMWAARL